MTPHTDIETGIVALLVPVEGPVRRVTIPDAHGADTGLRADALRDLTGAHHVDHMPGPDIATPSGWRPTSLIADEVVSGPREPNPRIGELLAERGDGRLLRGDVLVLGATSPRGDLTSLPGPAADALIERWPT